METINSRKKVLSSKEIESILMSLKNARTDSLEI